MREHMCVSQSLEPASCEHVQVMARGFSPGVFLSRQVLPVVLVEGAILQLNGAAFDLCREVPRELNHSHCLLHPSCLALCSERKANKSCWPLKAVIPESIPSDVVLLVSSLLMSGPMQDALLQFSNLVLTQSLRPSQKYVLS